MRRASWRGVVTVAGHEFRLRVRTGRWRWLLGAWFAVLLAFTALLRWALAETRPTPVTGPVPGPGAADVPPPAPLGTPMLGGLMLFVLGLALLVVPALTAQSVNGDRERGVLATLQVTLLTPAEIALGKLLAAWLTALVFLATTLPLVVWVMVEGGVGIARVVVTLLVVALLLGVMCAVAQCLSALLARTTTSAVLSYLTVFAATVGTVVVFALALPLTTTTEQVTERVPVWDDPPPGEAPGGPADRHAPPPHPPGQGEPDRWETRTYERSQVRPERVWWLLAPNPFVILADAAPAAEPRFDPRTGERLSNPLDPLGEIATAVRDARASEDPQAVPGIVPSGPEQPEPPRPDPVWPYGLAFDVLLAAGAIALTIRRLRTPVRSLPRGVRIA
ncbi:ABC transporter permease [Haloechinothrix sp. YIM 98757]|uniref:ABC transporter permease n=1 Tax=Haloechinothrix aidingensis TaxID=2752311 RepID=A0A838ABK3_9PSEU|nr:ABC transporter permease [Haloechinothrix aidingensis]